MSYHDSYECLNGDMVYTHYEYKCDECGLIMDESWPMCVRKDKHFCGECGLKNKLIDGFYYSKWFSCNLSFFSEYKNGEIISYSEKEYKKKLYRDEKIKKGEIDERRTPEYSMFRKNVYKRDEYTCQHCKKKGGKLNAHHIKSFKDFPKLRTEVNNAITLCEKCHKKEHKKLRELKSKGGNYQMV